MKITYISVFAQAQKMVGITAIEQAVNFVAGLSRFDQSVIDNFDLDQTALVYADSIGIPAKILAAPEVIAAKRKQRAEAQAKAEQAAQMQQISEGAAAAGKTAKDLGTTPMGGGGSALDAALGGITGNQP